MINVTENCVVARDWKGLAIPLADEIPAPPKLRLPWGLDFTLCANGTGGSKILSSLERANSC